MPINYYDCPCCGSGSGSGSGSGGSGTSCDVVTACCACVPARLALSGTTGCGGSTTLFWDSVRSSWNGWGNPWGDYQIGSVAFLLECVNDQWQLQVILTDDAGNGCGSFAMAPKSQSCSPFELVFELTLALTCVGALGTCDKGTVITFTITE